MMKKLKDYRSQQVQPKRNLNDKKQYLLNIFEPFRGVV